MRKKVVDFVRGFLLMLVGVYGEQLLRSLQGLFSACAPPVFGCLILVMLFVAFVMGYIAKEP